MAKAPIHTPIGVDSQNHCFTGRLWPVDDVGQPSLAAVVRRDRCGLRFSDRCACPLPASRDASSPPRRAATLKWAASLVQILGYSATAFGMTPLNIYLFLVGLIGWFAVGWLWRDRAIMLIHVVALGAMVAGLLNA